MDFTEDFIQENGLSDEQVTKITERVTDHVSELQKQWDGKANENAEKILEGASNLAISKMGIQGVTREKGEKFADFLTRTTPMYIDSALAKERETINKKQRELDEMMKKGGGDEQLKQELESLKKKEALFAEWEENDYKGKWEEANKEVESMKVNVAFNSIKPNFPENINKYEADHKWNTFKADILEKNYIKIVDDEAILVDKENEYKTQKLKDALSKDESISALLKGSNNGFGGKVKTVKLDNVPFELPENATSQDRTKAIREYLAGKGLSVTSNAYAKEFAELNSKILSQKTA